MKLWKRILVFSLAGSILGLGYYTFFGCTTNCPISSDPYLTMGYFGLIGLLIAPLWTPGKKKTKQET